MSTKWADPLVGVSHVKRIYKPQKSWTEETKQTILALRGAGKTTEAIQQIMRDEHGFYASISMYKRQFKLWGTRLHLNAKQRRYIIRERQRLGKMPVFKYINTGEAVDIKKLESLWKNKSRYIEELRDESVSPAGLHISSPPLLVELRSEANLMDPNDPGMTPLFELNQMDPQGLKGPNEGPNEGPLAGKDSDAELCPAAEPGHTPLVKERVSSHQRKSCNTSTALQLTRRKGPRPFQIDIFEDNHTMAWMDDAEADRYLLRVLRTLEIPVDYHLKAYSGGTDLPIPSFDEWERAHYMNGFSVANLESPPLSAWPLLRASLFLEDNLKTPSCVKQLQVPGYLLLGIDASVIREETPSTISDKIVEIEADSVERHSIFIDDLLGSAQEMEELRFASFLTRDENDLSQEERGALVDATERVLDIGFQANTARWDSLITVSEHVLEAVETCLDVFRHILGPIAPMTLDAERGAYRTLCDSELRVANPDVFDSIRSKIKVSLRKHWAAAGGHDWKTRDCLNILAEWTKVCEDEALEYANFAVALGADDLTALESRLAKVVLCWVLRKISREKYFELSSEIQASIEDCYGEFLLANHPLLKGSSELLLRLPSTFPTCVGSDFHMFRNLYGILRLRGRGIDTDMTIFDESVQVLLARNAHATVDDELQLRHRIRSAHLTILKSVATWPLHKIHNFMNNLVRMGDILRIKNETSGALRMYEQSLNCRVSYLPNVRNTNYRFEISNIVRRIVRAMIQRGPRLYLQPLIHYHIEKMESERSPFSGSVVIMVELYSKVIMRLMGLAEYI